MPKEISQTKASTVWFHLNLESKKQIDKKKNTKKPQTHKYRKKIGGCGNSEWEDRPNWWRELRDINF